MYCRSDTYAYIGAVMSKVKVAVVVGKRRCVARRLSIFAASFAGFLAAVSVAVLGIAHLADALQAFSPPFPSQCSASPTLPTR